MIALTLYSRPGCHLCDEMKTIVARVLPAFGDACTLTEVDISGDPALEAQYGLEIPVLLIDGKKAAKYRIDEGALRRAIADRVGRSGGWSGQGR